MASTNNATALNVTIDVVIPCLIIVALIAINALIFAYIIRKRRQIVYEDVAQTAGEEPCTSASAAAAALTRAPRAQAGDDEDECAIEMERL